MNLPNTELPSLDEFEKMCTDHDWYYHMSDDMRVYNKYSVNERKLMEIADKNKEYFTIYYKIKDKYYKKK